MSGLECRSAVRGFGFAIAPFIVALACADPPAKDDDEVGVTTNAEGTSEIGTVDGTTGVDGSATDVGESSSSESGSSSSESESESSSSESGSSSESESESSSSEGSSTSEGESSSSEGETDGACEPGPPKLDMLPDPDPPLPDSCLVTDLDWADIADFEGCGLCDDTNGGCAFKPVLACVPLGPGQTCAELCPSGNCAGFDWGICDGDVDGWTEPLDWCGPYEIDGECCTVGEFLWVCAE